MGTFWTRNVYAIAGLLVVSTLAGGGLEAMSGEPGHAVGYLIGSVIGALLLAALLKLLWVKLMQLDEKVRRLLSGEA